MDGNGRSLVIGKNNDGDGHAHTKRIRMDPLTRLTLIGAVPPGPVADVNAAPVLEEDLVVELAPVVAHDVVCHIRSLFCGS